MRTVEEELKNKDLYEKDIDSKKWHEFDNKTKKRQGKKYFTEQDMLVHALHADLIMCLYRCEVKYGKESGSSKTQVNETLTQAGVDL